MHGERKRLPGDKKNRKYLYRLIRTNDLIIQGPVRRKTASDRSKL